MRDAVIFDMDGTLCDTSSVVHLIEGDDKNYAAFHAASADCPPRAEVVEAARAEQASGRAILVVSSREFIWRDLTLDWLVKHGVPYDAVYLRIVGDYRKDVAIKKDILAQITSDGFEVLAAWDDKPSVLDLWREHDIEVHDVGQV
jgi:phosphoglycolate phosphatase-like HAD superfamily hydrolase